MLILDILRTLNTFAFFTLDFGWVCDYTIERGEKFLLFLASHPPHPLLQALRWTHQYLQRSTSFSNTSVPSLSQNLDQS